jgi:hypothetical protein
MIKKTKCSKGALLVGFYVEQFFIGYRVKIRDRSMPYSYVVESWF